MTFYQKNETMFYKTMKKLSSHLESAVQAFQVRIIGVAKGHMDEFYILREMNQQ